MRPEFTQSDIDFAVFMATRRRRPRDVMLVRPEVRREREYENETERLRSVIRVSQAREGNAA